MIPNITIRLMIAHIDALTIREHELNRPQSLYSRVCAQQGNSLAVSSFVTQRRKCAAYASAAQAAHLSDATAELQPFFAELRRRLAQPIAPYK